MLGAGIYGAETSIKADQYAGKEHLNKKLPCQIYLIQCICKFVKINIFIEKKITRRFRQDLIRITMYISRA
jgi:hypothetical protein